MEIIARPNREPASKETRQAEIDKLRGRLQSDPDNEETKFELAQLVPLPEAIERTRELTRQSPGNMIYRAELRRLLFRQASSLREAKRAGELRKHIDEILTLLPLYDSELLQAATLLARWTDFQTGKELPEEEKKRALREADELVVRLLRQHARIWRKHPQEVQNKLKSYLKDAEGMRYADLPEFEQLLEEMRGWVQEAK